MVGVDIGSSRVKLVELSPGRDGRYVVEAYAIEQIEERAIVEGNVEDPEKVASALSRALRRLGTRTRNAALAMPSSAVITKRITLPAGLSEDEYEADVESEAAQYIPFAIDEVNLDFEVIGPAAGAADGVDVLIAASRKEKVDDRVAIAQMCGLQPVVMDIDSHAAHRAFEHLQARSAEPRGSEVVALFDIGHTLSRTYVWSGGEAIFEREQAFGGQQLTLDLARAYGLGEEEAESAKRSGKLPEGSDAAVVEPYLAQAAGNAARMLQVFFASTAKSSVDRILLTGGACVVRGLVEAIAERTAAPVSVLDTLEGFEIATGVNEKRLRADSPALLTALGLAMRRFDQ